MGENIDIRKFLNAFKVLGGDEHGRIKYSKLALLLRQKMGISEEEVADLLETKTCLEGDELDYAGLCTSMLSVKNMFDHASTESKEMLKTNKRINTRTFTRRKGSGRSSSGSEVHEQNHLAAQNLRSATLKGLFFDTDTSLSLCGHKYLFEIEENSPVEIVAQSIDTTGCFSPSPAIEVLLFQEQEGINKQLVAFSSFTDSEGYCSIKTKLKRGKYIIVPVILKWDSSGSRANTPDLEAMIEVNNDGETVLTAGCKQALRIIFDCVDLDRNGLLCQSEFDLFIQHVCGETAADEWTTVEDNFDTVNGELSLDGFLSLYQMAVVTDPRDVSYMFAKMGLTNFHTLQKALPFLLTVSAKVATPVLKALPVSPLNPLMEEVFHKTAVEQGHCSKIRNMNDLLLYTHKLPHRVTIAVQNQSQTKVKVRLDCSNSENCISHRSALNHVIEVEPETSMVGHHLFPCNPLEYWSVHCVEALVE